MKIQKVLIWVFVLTLSINCSQQEKTKKESCNRSFAAISAFPPQERDQNVDLILYAACINDSK